MTNYFKKVKYHLNFLHFFYEATSNRDTSQPASQPFGKLKTIASDFLGITPKNFNPERRDFGRKALQSIAVATLPVSLTGVTIASIFASKNAEAFVPLIIGGVYLSAELVAALSVSATITAGYGINKTYDIIQNKEDNTFYLGKKRTSLYSPYSK